MKPKLVRGGNNLRFILRSIDDQRTWTSWNMRTEAALDPETWSGGNQLDLIDDFDIRDVIAELPSRPEGSDW